MARIKYSALVTEIAGSAGGTVFQRNAYGFTIKNKPTIVRPNTVLQSRSKTIIAQISKGWQQIGSTGRSNWETFAINFPQVAKKNPDANLSGYNAFLKWHAAAYLGDQLAGTFDDDPVTSLPAFNVPNYDLERSGSNLNLSVSWSLSSRPWSVNFFFSPPVLGSQLFVGSKYRYMFNNIDDSIFLNIAPRFIELFGRIPEVGEVVSIGAQLFTPAGGMVQALNEQFITVI